MDTCRNCQHWTHFMMAWKNQFAGTVGENTTTREDANYGHCLLTENTDYGFDRSALAKVGITDGVLITSAEFGCNQFQSLSDRYAFSKTFNSAVIDFEPIYPAGNKRE